VDAHQPGAEHHCVAGFAIAAIAAEFKTVHAGDVQISPFIALQFHLPHDDGLIEKLDIVASAGGRRSRNRYFTRPGGTPPKPGYNDEYYDGKKFGHYIGPTEFC
jgi:hypothetical protein